MWPMETFVSIDQIICCKISYLIWKESTPKVFAGSQSREA